MDVQENLLDPDDAHKLTEAEDPRALRDELMARIESTRGPIGPLSKFQIEEMVDPRDTRRLIREWVETAWPLVNLPDKLGPQLPRLSPAPDDRRMLRELSLGQRRIAEMPAGQPCAVIW